MNSRVPSVTTLGAHARALHLVSPAATVKALDALAQLAAGCMLVLLPSTVLSGAPNWLLTRDMVNDPAGRFAKHIATAAERSQQDGHMWLAIGLFAVALIKLLVSALVLVRARYGVLAAVLVFGVLTVFEAGWGGRSPLTVTVTAVDALIVVVLATQLVSDANRASRRS